MLPDKGGNIDETSDPPLFLKNVNLLYASTWTWGMPTRP